MITYTFTITVYFTFGLVGASSSLELVASDEESLVFCMGFAFGAFTTCSSELELSSSELSSAAAVGFCVRLKLVEYLN